MASIAIMIAGAITNAAAFTGGNYLAKYLSGDNGQAALDEKIRPDKALEQNQAAYEKWQKDRTELLDWVAEQDREKDKARYDFQTTDQALALYNQTHRAKVALPKEPEFSDFYKPSPQQQNGELLFIGASMLAVGYAIYTTMFHIKIVLTGVTAVGFQQKTKMNKYTHGFQTIKDLLKPQRLLERSCCCEKASCSS